MASGITAWEWLQLKCLDASDWLGNSALVQTGPLAVPLKMVKENPEYKKLMDEQRKKLEEIKPGIPYNFADARIERWYRVGGPPTSDPTSAFMVDEDGTKWFPKDGQLISTRAKLAAIHTNYDEVSFTVSNNPSFFDPSAKPRLFTVKPGSHVDFDVKGEKCSFVLKSGKLIEDKAFRAAAKFDEVMGLYSSVADTIMGGMVALQVDIIKKTVPGNTNDPKYKDALANAVIAAVSEASGGFGVLTGMAPPVMIPAEFAYTFFTNTLKAMMAYAISYSYTGKKISSDELKNDLYILLANDDVEMSLKSVADAAQSSGLQTIAWEAISKEVLWQKLGNKFLSIGKSTLQDAAMVKNTAAGIAKGVPIVSIAIGAVTNIVEAVKFGAQAKRYYNPAAPAATAKSFTVTFNRGTDRATEANPRTKTVTPPATKIDALPAPPACEGQTFKGWSIMDGKKTPFTESTPVTNNMDVVGEWERNVYTVRFFKNDGPPEPNPQTMTCGFPLAHQVGLNSLPPAPARTGYTFDGWNTKPDGTGQAFVANTSVKANTTVYAKWKGSGFTVTFDRNGGTTDANPTSKAAPNGGTVSLPANPSRKGYTFTGWNTLAGGGGNVFNQAFRVNMNITVYAQWKEKTYTVNYNTNGGSPIPSKQGVKWGDANLLPGNNPTKTNNTFNGWNVLSGGSGTNISNSNAFKDLATNDSVSSITLQAQWTANAAPKPASAPTPAPAPRPEPTPTPAPASAPKSGYNIGDTGPGGGIVFYAQGGRYKECSKEDLGGGKVTYDKAVQVCKDYRSGGKTDWHLVSKEGLNEMYNNLKKRGLGRFQNDSYFASDGGESGFAFAQNFQHGGTNTKAGKNEPRFARAARAF